MSHSNSTKFSIDSWLIKIDPNNCLYSKSDMLQLNTVNLGITHLFHENERKFTSWLESNGSELNCVNSYFVFFQSVIHSRLHNGGSLIRRHEVLFTLSALNESAVHTWIYDLCCRNGWWRSAPSWKTMRWCNNVEFWCFELSSSHATHHAQRQRFIRSPREDTISPPYRFFVCVGVHLICINLNSKFSCRLPRMIFH